MVRSPLSGNMYGPSRGIMYTAPPAEDRDEDDDPAAPADD
jgi:hypothetical protein